MSNTIKCTNCGSTDIEEDNARGDRVCTNCGSVLEDSIIVSEVQFEEANGGAAAIGQFVSSESSGGVTNIGFGKFQVGSGVESREITIKKAKREITHLCHQLRLAPHQIETAVNFFKMALMRHLTRGRKSALIYAACVYITCRTEGTSHLLIDISDIQQICSYELGRTYLKLSNALCINIPSVDPCIYIMRFANRLQFGQKTHEVSMTALRIVQRMKKDSIHSGRRPTGLCGAALLIAARMHSFNRSVPDIVRVVKIHESTLRKRLTEFADTPSSALTLEEFMSVDLEAEQDPPAFKVARQKDRDRIKGLGTNELTELQKLIDQELERDLQKSHKSVLRRFCGKDATVENKDATNFIEEYNMEILKSCINGNEESGEQAEIQGLRPDIEKMCIPSESELKAIHDDSYYEDLGNGEFKIDDINDNEIDNYVLSEKEAINKDTLWSSLNKEYLEELKVKQERIEKEREEGKPEKKKRKTRKRTIGPSLTAGEAIEKMCQEKKISSKINYDILKTLTSSTSTYTETTSPKKEDNKDFILDKKPDNITIKMDSQLNYSPTIIEESGPIKRKSRKIRPNLIPPSKASRLEKVSKVEVIEEEPPVVEVTVIDQDDVDYNDPDMLDDVDPEPEAEQEYSSLKDLLNQGEEEDDYYGYDEAY